MKRAPSGHTGTYKGMSKCSNVSVWGMGERERERVSWAFQKTAKVAIKKTIRGVWMWQPLLRERERREREYVCVEERGRERIYARERGRKREREGEIGKEWERECVQSIFSQFSFKIYRFGSSLSFIFLPILSPPLSLLSHYLSPSLSPLSLSISLSLSHTFFVSC